MNYFRKKWTSSKQAIPKANHGNEFSKKEKQYFEVEGMLKKLLKDVERYIALVNELCACKSRIYGQLFYFYSKQSEKRYIIEDLLKHSQCKMEKYVQKLSQDYESNLIDEIHQLLKIFPSTQRITSSLSMKKQQMLLKKQYYQSLKQPNKKVDYSEMCEVDEQVRILQHAYQFSIRTMIREFDLILDKKDSILDRFCVRMLHSDGKLYSHLFRSSRVLRDKALLFQYYRDYPQGLPSYIQDYSYTEDIQSSSDSDIDAPSANPFYSDISTKRQLLIHKLSTKYGFKAQRIQSVVQQHPNASYEKLLEILTNVKRPQQYVRIQSARVTLNVSHQTPITKSLMSLTQPHRYVMVQSPKLALSMRDLQRKTSPAPKPSASATPPPKYRHHTKPKPPKKRRALLKQIRKHSKLQLAQTQPSFAKTDSDLESETDSDSSPVLKYQKSMTALNFSRKQLLEKKRKTMKNFSRKQLPQIATRQRRGHSKSDADITLSHELSRSRARIRKRPPPPKRAKTPTTYYRQMREFNNEDDADFETHKVRSRRHSAESVHKKKSKDSTQQLSHSNTNITEEDDDPDDSLHERKTNEVDEDEGCQPSPSFAAPCIKYSILPECDVKKATKKKKKAIPKQYQQIAKLMQSDDRVQPWIWNKKNAGEENQYRYVRNGNPLGIGIHTIVNFKYMHQLLNPKQTRHIGQPSSSVMPNKIGVHHVVTRNVNIRRLTFNTLKFGPKGKLQGSGSLQTAQKLRKTQIPNTIQKPSGASRRSSSVQGLHQKTAKKPKKKQIRTFSENKFSKQQIEKLPAQKVRTSSSPQPQNMKTQIKGKSYKSQPRTVSEEKPNYPVANPPNQMKQRTRSNAQSNNK